MFALSVVIVVIVAVLVGWLELRRLGPVATAGPGDPTRLPWRYGLILLTGTAIGVALYVALQAAGAGLTRRAVLGGVIIALVVFGASAMLRRDKSKPPDLIDVALFAKDGFLWPTVQPALFKALSELGSSPTD